MSDLIRLAWRNIRSRAARSWMTVIGVLIGVTAIVALISIGTGVERSVLKQFEAIGYDLVILTGGAGAGAQGFAPPAVSGPVASTRQLDLSSLRQAVPGIGEAGALVNQVLPVSTATISGSLRVVAPSQEFLQRFSTLLGGFKLQFGGSFSGPTASEAILGARSAERLGVLVGDPVEIAGEPFLVVGVLAATGSGPGGPSVSAQPRTGPVVRATTGAGGMGAFRAIANVDDAMFIPYERAQTLIGQGLGPSTVAIRVRKGYSVSDAVSAIRAELARQGVPMNVVSTEELAKSIQSGIGMIEGVLASIAGISLLVGAVGLMNTMYTAVLERRREIGILKAIGATDRQVLILFLIDSGLMGLAGGILGLFCGAGVSLVGAAVLGRALAGVSFLPAFTPGLILGSLGLSLLLGAVSGVWPAWNAARLEPVQALASE